MRPRPQTMLVMVRLATLGIILAPIGCSPLEAQDRREPFPGLDAYVTKVMATWRVPGLSIAVVRNDSVVYAKGYGVRTIGGNQPVDEHTLFAIGSSGKAFTATLAAMLVSDGKLRWDDRVAVHVPGFRLYDAYANSELTIRDALTHRSGLSRGELVWAGSGLSKDEVLRRLRFLPPTWSFRSRFGYSNIMYLAAGEAAARAAGSTYNDLIRQRILTPLGMTMTLVDPETVADQGNIATAHSRLDDTTYTKPFWLAHNIVPAGMIVSNARDMAEWIRFQLADGQHNGKRLLSSAAFRETHRPQTIISGGRDDDDEAGRHFTTYGIGWFVQDYNGRLVWQHGGNTDGMTAMVAMLPEQEFGVVVLSNMAGSPAPNALARYLFDRHLNAPPRDWSAEAYERSRRGDRADSLAKARAASRIAGGRPPFPLEAYVGAYTDSLYGDLSVTIEQGRLAIERGQWHGPLEYWNGNTFRWNVAGSPGALEPFFFVRFDATPEATVNRVSFGLPGEVASFARKPKDRPSPVGQGTR